MDVECIPSSEKDATISNFSPCCPGPEGESLESAIPDSTTPDINFDNKDTLKEVPSPNEEGGKQKESKILTLKRFVTGKTKSKYEEKDKLESSENKDKGSHSSRELRKSLSRVFSVSSSSISRVWSSFSATRIHGEGESGSTKTLGKMFGRKMKSDKEDVSNKYDPETKTLTLGRRFSSTFRSAFGRSKES